MASLSLESRAQPDSPEHRIFNILNDYLQPSSTTPPREAAQAIHALTPKTGSTPEENSELEDFLWYTWGTIIKVAKQIPHNHPSQDRLVDLIHALTELPPTTVSIWGSENYLWKDLPMLGPSLRESWDPPAYTKPDDQEVTEWINLQAFTARLMSKCDPSLSLLGVWSLRSGLEEELSDNELEGEVAAAAMWMVYGSENLFSQLADAVEDEEKERLMKPGTLYSGQGQLSPERWQFWKQRFGEMSQQIQVSYETTGVIRLAGEKMESVEQ
ncbi:hypothetical protein ALT_6805 [Aspergillus lentulus]|uniref:Uncharacterized protein n=1 Tax=Aspergillus lentulus TaxID=293939 RepID=A0AAN4PNE6_ASPLE|nr:uncharacterized protein IFM58399_06586 [Aspergillus lentulus]GAQ09484.1 hypothetical protein ALT_6805 [Aspergillus lentulus]GFF42372.1 hypothetical protein IFM58399_06586 [Aspergillus lentulus]GFF46582.1 hypothetical protein IFM62136_00551 [Aspergillus lentulus]GFF65722.1 hypothetical protein IFM60648_01683 [Aspergillus lentulus]